MLHEIYVNHVVVLELSNNRMKFYVVHVDYTIFLDVSYDCTMFDVDYVKVFYARTKFHAVHVYYGVSLEVFLA